MRLLDWEEEENKFSQESEAVNDQEVEEGERREIIRSRAWVGEIWFSVGDLDHPASLEPPPSPSLVSGTLW